MRLYLSSYKFGNKPEKLFELLRGKKVKIAVITNAADLFPEGGIKERFNDDATFFALHGYKAERLDLRDYFGKQEELSRKLGEYGLAWIRGANVFVLRRAMAQSGFDKILNEKLKDDSIVYGGYSAGGCVLSPTLRGLELVDDAQSVPEGYSSEIIWDGLGIIPEVFVPHFKSDHPESEMVNESVEFLAKNGIPYKTLHDGEAIVINGDNEELVG